MLPGAGTAVEAAAQEWRTVGTALNIGWYLWLQGLYKLTAANTATSYNLAVHQAIIICFYGDQLDRSCKKLRSITQSQGGEEYPTYNKKKKV
jgi:hypothetical protein